MSRFAKTFLLYLIATLLVAAAIGTVWRFAPNHNPPVVILLVMGTLFITVPTLGLFAKAIPTRSGIARRHDNPFMYWYYVVIEMILGIALVVTAFNWK